MRALVLGLVTLLVGLSAVPMTIGTHAGCNYRTEETAIPVGEFYLSADLKRVHQETNGIPGLQPIGYDCYGHAGIYPRDICYFNQQQPTSLNCPSQVTNHWLA